MTHHTYSFNEYLISLTVYRPDGAELVTIHDQDAILLLNAVEAAQRVEQREALLANAGLGSDDLEADDDCDEPWDADLARQELVDFEGEEFYGMGCEDQWLDGSYEE
jgi:hypothetical protein